MKQEGILEGALARHYLMHKITCEEGALILTSLIMTWRPRDVEKVVQTHTAKKGHSQDLNPGLFDAQALVFPLCTLWPMWRQGETLAV